MNPSSNATERIEPMKKRLLIITTAVGLVGVLPFAVTLAQAQSTNSTAPKHKEKGEERHPAIHRAIIALDEAEAYLRHAEHDFGGHRKEVLEECTKAREQLKLALKFDKK